MSDCTHDCSTCGESCGERKEVNVFEKKPLRPGCRVGKVYGIVSSRGTQEYQDLTVRSLATMTLTTPLTDADRNRPRIVSHFEAMHKLKHEL